MQATCPECGAGLRPLAYSLYCPNDCDRKPTVAHPAKPDFEEEEVTPLMFGISFDTVLPECPMCSSQKVGVFPYGPAGTSSHCWDCGHVW